MVVKQQKQCKGYHGDSTFPLRSSCRLWQVDQYRNLIFHGLEGSCQEDIANAVACCIKVGHRCTEQPKHLP